MATWETVREIAAGLPEAEESSSYGTPAFKVRGKLFARLRDDGDTLAVRVDRLEREALVETYPAVFFVTPHYAASRSSSAPDRSSRQSSV